MANGGQIDIKVNFIGLDDLDRIMQQAGQGANQVGNQVNRVSRAFDSMVSDATEGLGEYAEGVDNVNENLRGLNENLSRNRKRQKQSNSESQRSIDIFGSLSTAIGQTGGAFGTMGDAQSQAFGGLLNSSGSAVGALGQVSIAAKAAGGSFMTMLGPIGLVAVGVFELVKAFRTYLDTQDKVQAKVDAYKASLSEMTTTYEILAAKQVEVSKEEMRELQRLNNEGKIRIELAQELRETQKNVYRELARAEAKAEKQSKELQRISALNLSTEKKRALAAGPLQKLSVIYEDQRKLKEQLNKMDERALEIAKEGYPFRLAFEQKLLELEQRSPILLKQRAEQEQSLLMQLEQTKNKTFTQSYETRLKAYELEFMARKAQIQKMKFTDEAYYERALYLAGRIYDEQVFKLNKQEDDLAKARSRARAKARQRQKAKELADQQRAEQERFNLAFQAIQNNIKLSESGFTQERRLLEVQYAQKVALAKDNHQKLLIAEQEYQLALNALNQRQEEAELMAWKKSRDEKVRQYQKEIDDIKKRNQAILDAQREITEGAKETALAMGESALATTVSSLAAGESVTDVLGQVLQALSTEAAVQSAMHGAKALAALATGDLRAASLEGAASMAFAGVATLAGVLSSGAGASTTSTPSASASPTGAPLVSTPERETERTESQPIVFNISMGTVYSTEETALTALTNAITREQNRVRRGAPRNA